MLKTQPPKDGLVRARPGLEVREADDDAMPRLTGYMLRFDEPTEIDSLFEGRFIEEIEPGAADKTLHENRTMRILFNHGSDPHIGEKPLAEPRFVEDNKGVRYDEPELLDTDYNRELVPGLRAGQYGSSFKFRVVKEEIDEEPGRSDDNPDGLPVRRITELKLYEGGPVVFPAYESSSAGVRTRSMTDQVFIDGLKRDPERAHELDEVFRGWVKRDPERVRSLLEEIEMPEPPEATDTDTSEADPERANEPSPTEEPPVEGTPDDDNTTALSEGAENSHSDDGSRTAPWRDPNNGVTPPWRRDSEPVPPWHSEKEK